MKPKRSRKADPNKSAKMDRCQTPFYAVDLILPYIPRQWRIWESAAGEGHIVQKMTQLDYVIFGTDVLTGDSFFKTNPQGWDCQITNPPFSVKYDWLRRSYELGKPFALLLPLETLGAGAGVELFDAYGIEMIIPDRRINFKMPNKGYSGNGAQFPTAWFTSGLGIGRQLTFAKVTRYADGQLNLFDAFGIAVKTSAQPPQLQPSLFVQNGGEE